MAPKIIEVQSKSQAQELEIFLIDLIGRADLKTGPLFNRAPGGGGRGEWTEEQKAAKSKLQIIEWQKPGKKESHSKKVKTAMAEMSPASREKWIKQLSEIKTDFQLSRSDEQKAITSAKMSKARQKINANISEQTKAEIYKKVSASLCRRCTIDGIKIYESQKLLIAELGYGIAGKNHPNFRYINE